MTKASDAAVTCVEMERERTVVLNWLNILANKKWSHFELGNGAESQAFDRVILATHRSRGRNQGPIQRSVAIAIAVDRLRPHKWHDSRSSCDRRSDEIGDSLNFSWNPVILAEWFECEKTEVSNYSLPNTLVLLGRFESSESGRILLLYVTLTGDLLRFRNRAFSLA